MKTKKTKTPAAAPLSVADLENVTDLYIRVSTAEQAEEGYSVGEQEARLRSYCEAYGYIINAVHVDPGYSGATLERPGIKEVIKDVRAGRCNKVIVWKLDRLSRSQKDTLILLEDVFLENSCDFVSLMESFDTSTPFGRCVIGILAAFAQMERENIRARLMMGKQAGLKAGNYYGPTAPIGYKWEMQPNGKRELLVDPFYSQIIQEAYRLYGSGQSLSDVVRVIKAKYGHSFATYQNDAATRLGRVLRNPIYAGRVRMVDREYEGKHEALVSPEIWQAVNNRLSGNAPAYRNRYGNGSKGGGLCSGLLFCGCCGGRLSIRGWGYKSAKVDKYVCYSVSKCNKRMIKDPNCTNRKNHFKVEDLDALIVEEVKKLSLDPAALDALLQDGTGKPGPEEEAAAFRERMENVERQITRLLNLYQAGAVDLEEIAGRLSDLKEERAALSCSLEELENDAPGKMSKEEARAAVASFSSVVASGDPVALFALVHSLIEKIEVLNGDITIFWKFQ